MRSTKILKICSSSLCTCLHHMVILRTRNKITDFLMILAWASPFNTAPLVLKGRICHLQSNRDRILVQVTIHRRLMIGRDGHLDQS